MVAKMLWDMELGLEVKDELKQSVVLDKESEGPSKLKSKVRFLSLHPPMLCEDSWLRNS